MVGFMFSELHTERKILVHIHLFYHDMWPEIQNYLQNIHAAHYDLVITTPQYEPSLVQKICLFKPQAIIHQTDNKGYDVWPFIMVLNHTDLSQYDYIIKLHTKRDMRHGSTLKHRDVSGHKWRTYLYHFLKDKNYFQRALHAFHIQDNLGMIAHHHIICTQEPSDLNASSHAYTILKNMGLHTQKFSFVAGTMFMARAHIFKPLKTLNLTSADFELPSREYPSTLSHAFERLFGLLPLAQGYTIQDIHTPQYLQAMGHCLTPIRKLTRKNIRFFYQAKTTKNGKKIIKICKIPIWYSQR